MPRRQRIKHRLLLRAAVTFYNWIMSDALWPTFVARFPELAKLIEHEDRGTRRDLRETLALVVWCCLARMDLKSFRVGRRTRYETTDGRVFDFVGLPREVLAQWTELHEVTVSRALTLLRRGDVIAGPGRDGYNVIPQPCEHVDISAKTPNGVRGLPAIRRFFESFFERLGLKETLDHCRKPKAAAAAPTGEGAAVRNAAAAGDVVDALARALGPPPVPG